METLRVNDLVKIIGGERGRIVDIVDFGGYSGYEIVLENGETTIEARYRLDPDIITETISRPPETERENPPVGSPPVLISDKEIVDFMSNVIEETISRPPETERENPPVGSPPVLISDKEIVDFIAAQDNANTARKTLSDVNIVKAYMSKHGFKSEPYEYDHQVLAKILTRFFIEAKRQDGSEYEPTSLRAMMSSIDRYLKRNSYQYSLIQSQEFSQLREVLKAKQIKLKKEGKGNKPKKADDFTDEDLNILYTSGQLGENNPEALLRTIWLLNSIYFGMRGVTEHRDMSWGDVTLCQSSDGKEYLEYNERTTKTRSGKNPRDTRLIKPKAWALPQGSSPQRCPVYMYKLYKSLRPTKYCSPDAPYYIATNTRFSEASMTWFKSQPVGVNKLGTFMRVMAKKASLTEQQKENEEPAVKKRLTNHSTRKYLVQKLKDNNVADTEIVQITGHKNVQSVNSYGTISERRHQQIASFLSGQGTATGLNTPSPLEASSSHAQRDIIHHSQSNASRSSTAVNTDSKSMFGGVINGGTFHVTVHHHAPKMRRYNVIDSDSDSS